ncbi:MAG: hypothetical protein KGQ88_00520 [Chloroflexi bacterium]|nr:hypothetical protein [Chloroflexota bacterium]
MRRDDGGQAIVLVAITILGMLMAVGLAIDSGQLYNGRRTAQEAADSAAFAGATVLYQKGCPWSTCTSASVTVATAAAASDAELNGFCQATSGLCASDTPASGTTVTITSPITSTSYGDPSLCVQVVISTPVKTTLVPQAQALTTVRATAIACAAAFNASYAMMSTDSGCDSKALVEQSQGTLTIDNGNLQIDSCSTSAGYAQGKVRLDSGYSAYIVGGASPWPDVSPGTTVTNTGNVQADPFAGTPPPPMALLTAQSCGGPALQPGIYDCRVGNGTYTMAPGTYVFEGHNNGISLSGGSSLTGTGVLIYLTTPDTAADCATFSMSGNSSVELTGPISGPYKGLLMYQDPRCTGTIQVGGNGAIGSLSGSIYAPAGTVAANGNPSSFTMTQVIAFQESVQNGNFTIDYSSGAAYVGYLPALMR